MTTSSDDRTAPTLRRPPAPPTVWASVTSLGEARPREANPVSARPAVDGSLALSTSTSTAATPGPPCTPELRLVPGGTGPDKEEVEAWAARFAQAVVEVIGGDRPLSQLIRWTSRRVYVEIERRLALLARTTDAGRRRRTVRPQVRSVHVCLPAAHTAEVSVHVRYGRRSRAIAARLELIRGRWQCTVLQLG